MSAAVDESYLPIIYRPFTWTPQRSEAAVVLATGGTRNEAAEAAHCDRSTIFDWLKHPDFCAEIDRLSLMVSISSRAERLRHAMRVVKSRLDSEGVLKSDKDSLDWLKFAQSETDGAKIDLSKLAEMLGGGAQDGVDSNSNDNNRLLAQSQSAIDVEATARAVNGCESQSLTTEHGPDEELNAS